MKQTSNNPLIKNKDVKKLVERLDFIEEKYGHLKAEYVVEDSKRKDSPFKTYIDWNNRTASDKYRIIQARDIIRCIHVEVTYEGNKIKSRSYFNVTTNTEQGNESVYVNVETAMSDEKLRKQVLSFAIKELIVFQRKYEQLKELQPVFKIIKTISKNLRGKNNDKRK